jgi:hypothetical protein
MISDEENQTLLNPIYEYSNIYKVLTYVITLVTCGAFYMSIHNYINYCDDNICTDDKLQIYCYMVSIILFITLTIYDFKTESVYKPVGDLTFIFYFLYFPIKLSGMFYIIAMVVLYVVYRIYKFI